MQDKEPLTALLNRLQELNALKDSRKPILLKIAPDLTNNQLDDIIEIIAETKIDGIVDFAKKSNKSFVSILPLEGK